MIAVYGPGVLGLTEGVGYEGALGLWLNLPRVRLQLALAHLMAIGAAGSKSDLGIEWADAMAQVPEEVDFIHFAINAERQRARTAAKLGFGG